MRKWLFCLLLMSLVIAGCKKNSSCTTTALVTQTNTPCLNWGIRILNVTYPSKNIPDAMKQEGLVVCIDYELYEDMALCACCGGTWADIQSMTVAN